MLRPHRLPGALASQPVEQMAAGASHSVLLLRKREVVTFGRNSYGQLGLYSAIGASPAAHVDEARHRAPI